MLKILLQNPRALLLFDAFGAVLTSIATAHLLAGQRIVTGIPSGILYGLAITAACFACFDLIALSLRLSPAFALRLIASANVAYCVLVLASQYYYRSSATNLGVAYFCMEISIVLSLAVWQWVVALRNENSCSFL
jgi:hypothetical protein